MKVVLVIVIALVGAWWIVYNSGTNICTRYELQTVVTPNNAVSVPRVTEVCVEYRKD